MRLMERIRRRLKVRTGQEIDRLKEENRKLKAELAAVKAENATLKAAQAPGAEPI